MHLRCKACKVIRPLANFYRRKTGYIIKTCKLCQIKIARKWADKNYEKFRLSNDKAVFKHRYGITVLDYARLARQQNHLCAICREKETFRRRLSVDHDHVTKKVRGLLCNWCNVRLCAIENPWFHRQAEKYLRRKPCY